MNKIAVRDDVDEAVLKVFLNANCANCERLHKSHIANNQLDLMWVKKMWTLARNYFEVPEM